MGTFAGGGVEIKVPHPLTYPVYNPNDHFTLVTVQQTRNTPKVQSDVPQK